MLRRTILAILPILGILTSGCPVVRLDAVKIQEDSVTPTSFKLQLDVLVVEDVAEDAVDSRGNPVKLRGIAGFWLPEGWAVEEVRMKSPDGDGFTSLHPVTSVVPFPRTFPHTSGAWWAFVTNCTHVPVGTWTYNVELKVSTPEGASAGNMGLIISEFDAAGNYTDSKPMEISLDLAGKRAEVIDVDRATLTPINVATGTDLGTCGKTKVARGPRGCSCQHVGATAATTSLGSLLQSILF